MLASASSKKTHKVWSHLYSNLYHLILHDEILGMGYLPLCHRLAKLAHCEQIAVIITSVC